MQLNTKRNLYSEFKIVFFIDSFVGVVKYLKQLNRRQSGDEGGINFWNKKNIFEY